MAIWALVRSFRALGTGRTGAAPPRAGRPSRPEPAGSRRPMLTVAAELAAIVGLLIAFIALMKSGGS
ncbi:hypothetical protein [Streptomyces sp. HD]|uniref:hypothetical protein n=1 Tax=Streptomyces sp. HD TaxID=3020892 RepID=UPI00232DD7E3|nr:hypothetical protein [Streptomyces sp. HD]MDC0767338.1 hypothetical protein [Streptomyces sp. HD]